MDILPQHNREDKSNPKREYSDTALRMMHAYYNSTILEKIIMMQTFEVLMVELDATPEQRQLLSKEIISLLSFWFIKDVRDFIKKDRLDSKDVNALLSFWFQNAEIEKYAKAVTISDGVQMFEKNASKIFDCFKTVNIPDLDIHCEVIRKNIKDAFTLPISEIKKYIYKNGKY